MGSSIVISGVVLWVVLALFLLLAFCFIVIGCSYINSERERERLKILNRNLRSELSLYEAEFNVMGLKAPQFPRK